jgi:hypothetical protein
MRKILATLLFLWAANANAQFLNGWSSLDKTLLVASTTANIVDWGQTRTIAMNPDIWHETNPFLGEHPSVGEVNAYFIVRLLLIPLAAHYLPDYRTAILSTWFGIGIGYASHNQNLGIRMTW